jgi:ribosomal protein L37AE/L43A
MSELKACPFCECTEIVAGKDYTRGDYRVDCLGCSAFITAPSLELAIQYWNTRPIEDKLQAEIARLKAELRYTDDLLKEATETIGAVIACCTYDSNNDAKIGVYGIDQNAFTKIDQFITRYNDAVSTGKVSVDVKQVKCALSDAEIEELGAQEAERKEFCPNCEAETPCTHEAELFVCDICGEDFAKYIVSRNCNVSDVSMTQDVLTGVETPRSIENNNPDYYKDELYLDEDFRMLAKTYPADVSAIGVKALIDYVEALEAELAVLKSERRWIPVSEPPKKNGYFWCSIVDDAGCKWADKRLFSVENGWFTFGEQVTHWMPLPAEPPSEEEC